MRKVKASNPKDLVYGVLGLSKFEVILDYSENKTIQEAYYDYIKASFANPCTNSPTNVVVVSSLLDFLQLAGAGFVRTFSEWPSWVPEFRDHPKKKLSKAIYGSHTIIAIPLSHDFLVSKANICSRMVLLLT